jgi:hypothetical protein
VESDHWQNGYSPMPTTNSEYLPQTDYGFPDESQWPMYEDESAQHYQSLGGVVATPQSEEPMDEKARLRHAEQTLLPSRPPDDSEPGPSTGHLAIPTAPVLPEDDHINGYHHLPSPVENGLPHTLGSAESVQTVVASSSAAEPNGSAEPPGEDKQELERRRLMMEASAPEDMDALNDHSTPHGPSAPVFHDDHDEQLVGGAAHGDESLPRYQR